MNRKNEAPTGVFSSFGRALDESVATALSAGSGKMSREEFDAWWGTRRAEAMEMMAALRERAPDLRKPVETLLQTGREIVGGGSAGAAPVRHGRTSRRAFAKAARRR